MLCGDKYQINSFDYGNIFDDISHIYPSKSIELKENFRSTKNLVGNTLMVVEKKKQLLKHLKYTKINSTLTKLEDGNMYLYDSNDSLDEKIIRIHKLLCDSGYDIKKVQFLSFNKDDVIDINKKINDSGLYKIQTNNDSGFTLTMKNIENTNVLKKDDDFENIFSLRSTYIGNTITPGIRIMFNKNYYEKSYAFTKEGKLIRKSSDDEKKERGYVNFKIDTVCNGEIDYISDTYILRNTNIDAEKEFLVIKTLEENKQIICTKNPREIGYKFKDIALGYCTTVDKYMGKYYYYSVGSEDDVIILVITKSTMEKCCRKGFNTQERLVVSFSRAKKIFIVITAPFAVKSWCIKNYFMNSKLPPEYDTPIIEMNAEKILELLTHKPRFFFILIIGLRKEVI